ncbi:MAG: tRNA (uridine(54)-C5)-methyltransferase TrmA, partial [Campylobacteraceae bacterium]|nr:tRNA (uridine(54)-C5)-methyltransferase TrmA [Campylobacteraceae bacterium]MBT4707582.1 tRNA (uridine(54)-C5)-methyltransferase TrmA [Campylobacteraceae bacterium]MBT5983358.1 tRNA (uridine(54)-C5)-methyltransferase TrmA [Campylobacteraceae bacterium]MBT6388341.1 tRNA (uridine(54)-C5)-methyltransferase TrmA [Campylobacteraceae bacterium]MBT6578571.1 tRNA (uridine(54)-C5)-methyltransferase TrmA [Campylobacteraceae bacterium]
MSYDEQLEYKISKEQSRFENFYTKPLEVIKSADGAFRNRAEFRIFHKMGKISYAMNDINRKLLSIDSCSIVSDHIASLMDKLLVDLQNNDQLNRKLFMIEFLGSTSGDMLVTLIYHRKLDESWESEARILQDRLNIKIIGRSRKQKVILDIDTIDEKLTINNTEFQFKYQEGGFTQPNQKVNEKMIEWVLNNIEGKDDLCELYCGGGNFTIPLSKVFNNVLATEISKTSIRSAKVNCTLNDVDNIKFIRMSSEEFVEARTGVREYRRLKQEDVNLDSYNFSTIFMDPPRAGLDDTTRELSKQFE